MKATLTFLLLFPILATAQISNSNLGVSLGFQHHINRNNSTNPLNSLSHTGTLGVMGALEWTIPVTRTLSVIPHLSYHTQSTRYHENYIYEDLGVQVGWSEKYRFRAASIGMDLSHEIKNGLCLKTGVLYSSFANTGGSSRAMGSSWKGSEIDLMSSDDLSNLGFRSQMFRGKIGTYKKIFIGQKEKFNVGIDLIIPFRNLASFRTGRIIRIDGNIANQQHLYNVRALSSSFYCKYNFINLQKKRPKKRVITSS